MTPADYAWPADDLRARLEIAEATNHVLTELLYRVAGILTPDQIAILGLTEHLSRPLRARGTGCTTDGANAASKAESLGGNA